MGINDFLEFGAIVDLVKNNWIILTIGTAVTLLGKNLFKQLLMGFNEKIGKPLVNRCIDKFSSIVFRDKEKYRNLCRKLVRDYYIGGLKDYTPHKNIDNVYINLKCGSINDGDHSIISGLVINDDELPIKNRKELHSYAKGSDNNVLMLLGGPGSGKTTAVNHILQQIISDKIDITPIPIIVREIEKYVDQLVSGLDLLSLTKIYFEERVCRDGCEFPVDWLSRRLGSGKCLILIDGIDEIQLTGNKSRIIGWIKREIKRNRENKFILTSRPHGVDILGMPTADIKYICPLDDDDIQSFITRWYEKLSESDINKKNKKDHESIRSRRKNQSSMLAERVMSSPILLEFARKPMILTMMIVVHETGNTLPERRSSLFDRVVTVMLGDRNQAREIPNKIAPEHKLSLLAKLAFSMKYHEVFSVLESAIVELVEKCRNDFDREINADDFLLEAVINSGLLVSTQGNKYTFCHPSFRDYFAAQYLRENQAKININYLYKLTKNEKWTETLLLLAGQIDVTPLLRKILKSKTKNNLEFLLALLDEAHKIEVSTRKDAHAFIENLIDQSNGRSLLLIGRAFLRYRLKDISGKKEKILDTKLISNIEYFYYLKSDVDGDEKIVPLSWKDGCFNKTKALQPVRGVALLSSKNFCKWLTSMYGNGWEFRIPNKGDLSLLHEKMKPSFIYFWLEGVNSNDICKLYGDQSSARLFSTVKDSFVNILVDDLVVCSRLLASRITGKHTVLCANQQELCVELTAADMIKNHINKIITIKDEKFEYILLRSYFLGLNTLKLLGEVKKYEDKIFSMGGVDAICSKYKIEPPLKNACEKSANLFKKSLLNLFYGGDIFDIYGSSGNNSVEYLEYNLGLINVSGTIDKKNSKKLSALLTIANSYEENERGVKIRPFFWLYRLVALYSAFSGGRKNIDFACLQYTKSALYEKSLDDEMVNQIGLLIIKEAI